MNCSASKSPAVSVRNTSPPAALAQRCDVMDHLAHRPAAVAVRRVELRIAQSIHRCAHPRGCGRDLLDESAALVCGVRTGGTIEFSDGVAKIGFYIAHIQRSLSRSLSS